MLQSSLSYRSNRIGEGSNNHLGEPNSAIPIGFSPSASSSSSDVDFGRDPLQPHAPAAFCWAAFADPALIGEPSFIIGSPSRPLLLALLRDNLSLLSQLPDSTLDLDFSLFLPQLIYPCQTNFITQPVEHLLHLAVFLSNEKLQTHAVNDDASDRRDTLSEPSDAWKYFFKLYSQIQSIESEIHIRQLPFLGLKSGSPSSVRLFELK